MSTSYQKFEFTRNIQIHHVLNVINLNYIEHRHKQKFIVLIDLTNLSHQEYSIPLSETRDHLNKIQWEYEKHHEQQIGFNIHR